MKRLLLLPLLFSLFVSNAQTTAIPDANFEQALITYGYDAVLDGQVLTANISSVTVLLIPNQSISDLTGIEDFSSLTDLVCNNNLLTTLNITQNSALVRLECNYNQLTSIDVSQAPSLTTLWLGNNLLTSIDVSQNPNLDVLTCTANQLTNIDVTQNLVLTELGCALNQITSLNLIQNTFLVWLSCGSNQLNCLNVKNGNNLNFIAFYANNNPNLTCIEVDNVAYSTTNWTNIDAGASFSTNCPTPCAVGLNELTASSISTYPNPTTGQLTISLAKGRATTVTLSNSLGQIILSEKHPASNELVLDISAYPTGIYFLQLEVDGQIITKKIVKG